MLDATQPRDRRTFLADLGRGAFALAIFGAVGCSPAAVATARPSASAAGSGSPPGGASPSTSPSATGSAPPSGGGGAGGGVSWERVNLGFVSAYVLVRGGEAASASTGQRSATSS